MNFFCSACRKEYSIDKYDEFLTKTDLKMARINCPVCGLELFRRLDIDYDLDDEQFKKRNGNSAG